MACVTAGSLRVPTSLTVDGLGTSLPNIKITTVSLAPPGKEVAEGLKAFRKNSSSSLGATFTSNAGLRSSPLCWSDAGLQSLGAAGPIAGQQRNFSGSVRCQAAPGSGSGTGRINQAEVTEMAWQPILASPDVAKEAQHQVVESEHLMKALLEQRNGLARRVFTKAGADNSAMLQATERFMQRQPKVSGDVNQMLGRELELPNGSHAMNGNPVAARRLAVMRPTLESEPNQRQVIGAVELAGEGEAGGPGFSTAVAISLELESRSGKVPGRPRSPGDDETNLVESLPAKKGSRSSKGTSEEKGSRPRKCSRGRAASEEEAEASTNQKREASSRSVISWKRGESSALQNENTESGTGVSKRLASGRSRSRRRGPPLERPSWTTVRKTSNQTSCSVGASLQGPGQGLALDEIVDGLDSSVVHQVSGSALSMETADGPRLERLTPLAWEVCRAVTGGRQPVEEILEANDSKLTNLDLLHILQRLGKQSVQSAEAAWAIALRVFHWAKNHPERGCQLEEKTVEVVINLLGQTALPQAMKLFHSLRSSGQPMSIYTYTAMISATAQAGRYSDALAIFDLLKSDGVEPTLVTYNVIIGVLGKQANSWARIMDVMEELRARGLQPDLYTYNHLLAACARSRLCTIAEEVFTEMQNPKAVSLGVQPDVVTYNALLECYGKAGKLDLAKSVLDRMQLAGLEPSVRSYNELIHAYSLRGMFAEAIQLYKDMKGRNLCPDVYTYSTLLVACGKAGLVLEATALYQRMQRSGCKPNLYIYNSLIDLYGKRGRLPEMAQVFQDLQASGCKPDIVTFNSLLYGYGRMGAHADLVKILEMMKEQDCQFTRNTYNVLISAYGRCGMRRETDEIFQQMGQAGHVPCVATYTSLLAAYARFGEWQKAEETILQMRQEGLTPGEKALSALIHAYANAGEAAILKSVVQNMRARGELPPNSYVLQKTLVLAFCRTNDAWEAEWAFNDLLANGNTPDMNILNALLFMYGKGGNLKKVEEVQTRITAAGLAPNLATYNTLMEIYGRQGLYSQAEEALRTMQKAGLTPDIISYDTLILTFCKHGHLDDGLRVLREMQGAGLQPTKYTYNSFAAYYFEEGRFEEGFQAVEQMRSDGCNLMESTYRAFIDAYCRLGRSKEAERNLRYHASYNEDLDPRTFRRLMSSIRRHEGNGSDTDDNSSKE